MKGIILSGGTGSRLYPMTQVVNKQLLPVYDKPMIYYPLSTLIAYGIQDICIISSPEFINSYKILFKNSKELGLNITYKIQNKPEGIAQSFIIAEDFIGNDSVTLILGDNIFHGHKKIEHKSGGIVFAYEVKNPQDYAVVEFNNQYNVISLIEKPQIPKTKFAVPGFYVYDNNVIDMAKNLKPSKRGELEITDINNEYLKNQKLSVVTLPKGFVWLDAGQPETLQQAAAYIQTIQERQGIKIGCIEEECFKAGFINSIQMKNIIDNLPKSEYKTYLQNNYA
jgi:glucose-1-phosphate thymidylyltransferase